MIVFLLAETAFAIDKITLDIENLIDSMEEKRLEKMCDSLIEENNNLNN